MWQVTGRILQIEDDIYAENEYINPYRIPCIWARTEFSIGFIQIYMLYFIKSTKKVSLMLRIAILDDDEACISRMESIIRQHATEVTLLILSK